MRTPLYKKYFILFFVAIAFFLTAFSAFLLYYSSSKIENRAKDNFQNPTNIVDTLISNFSKNQNKISFSFNSLNESEKKFIVNILPSGLPSSSTRVTSDFGYRLHPILKERRFHSGLDFGGKMGTPIKATADGFVEFSGKKGGYGNFVLLHHEFGFKSAYGHMEANLEVRSGSYVKKGDVIGYLGNSGRSTGPHLHYEIKYGENVLNPLGFINLNYHNFDQFISLEKGVNWISLINVLSKMQNSFLLLAQK